MTPSFSLSLIEHVQSNKATNGTVFTDMVLIGPRSNKPLPGATAVCPHLTDVRHTPLRKDTDFMSTPNWALSPIKRGPDTTLPPAPLFPFSERKKIRKQKPADNMSPYSKHQTATRVPKHTRKAVFVNPS